MSPKSYEEYFPCAEELAQLEKNEPARNKTYRELMCHFYICLDIYPSRENVNNLKSLVEYLFPIVDRPVENLKLQYRIEGSPRPRRRENMKTSLWRRTTVNMSKGILS